MEDSIKIFYEGLKTPTFFIEEGEISWKNKAASRLDKNKKIVKKILELKFSKKETHQCFVIEGVKYEVVVRPFKDSFFIEIFKEDLNVKNLIQKYYEGLKTPVFLCRGNNIIWHNVAATEFFSDSKFKQSILKYNNCKEEVRETFICNDNFFKVFIRPFEEFFYVEIVEKQSVGFNSYNEQKIETNELLESEILDNISRSVVHDVSQALSQISDILEKNNNFAGLEFVDIILKRMYSFMRATNLCYEYEILLKEKDNMNAEIVDIFVEIDALCSAIKSLIGKSQVSFKWDVPKDKIFCDIDMHKLGFALFHLICNSYRFSNPGSEVKVTAKLDKENYIVIEVCDTGVGIPKDMLDKVLKPFFSYDGFSGDIAGVGLGLTYVGLFADKVNGSFNIDSSKEGTRVTLSMPIVSLSDVMGLSSHIVNYNESKYDNMVATLVGALHEQKLKV